MCVPLHNVMICPVVTCFLTAVMSRIRLQALCPDTHHSQTCPSSVTHWGLLLVGSKSQIHCHFLLRHPGTWRSGWWREWRLSKAPALERHVGAVESVCSLKTTDLTRLFFFSSYWILNDLKLLGWNGSWGLIVWRSMGIGSSFAPRSDQIFTIRYVRLQGCGCLTSCLLW